MIKIDDTMLNFDYSENCFICKHFIEGDKHICKAFPEGISDKIFYGVKKHSNVLKNQKGKYIFERKKEAIK